MNPVLGALEQLLALSEAMLTAARNSDWASLADHEAQRRALAETLPADLSSSLTPSTLTPARAIIESCRQCDAGVRELVTRRQAELRVVLRSPPMDGDMAPASVRAALPVAHRRAGG